MIKKKDLIEKIILFLTNSPKEYFAYWFFIVVFFIIIYKLFYFTVTNHEYYAELATKQQTSQLKTPLSRWAIYSSNEKWKVLATSVDLYDLAIDPSAEWNKNKLSSFLTDSIYNEICYLKNSKECKKSLIKFMWVLEIPDFTNNEIFIKQKLTQRINEKISRTKVTSVLVADNITNEQAFDIEKLKLAWVYLNWTNLYVNPEEIWDQQFVCKNLSNIIWTDDLTLKNLTKKRNLRYVPIISKLSISTSENIKSKLKEEQLALEWWFIEKKDWISNFIIMNSNQQRFYPEWDLASTVLWYMDNAWVWNYWIEWYFDSILKWKQAKTDSKKDIMWRVIDSNSSLSIEDEKSLAWANITLTIDKNIQKAVEEIIDEDNQVYKANDISVIIMDPKTWYIKAMASTSRYDPNNPWDAFELEKVTPVKYPNPAIDLLWSTVLAVDNKDWKEYYYNWKKIFLREISREELWNNTLEKYVYVNKYWAWVYKNDMVQDLYEPGSIFKSIVMAAWIDTWEISRFDSYKDEWYVQIDQFKIKNSSSACTWFHTYSHALDYSCNVWMIRIAQKIWASIFSKYIDLFWIWKKTWIELDWEVFWKLDPYEKWSKAQLFTTSFGKWITATTLQMAAVYSVFANGWVYVKPQIVQSIEFADGRVITNKPEITHRVIKESTSKIMTQALVESVNLWVAKKWWVPWYSIAWKTSSSQIVYKWKYEDWQASTMWAYAWYAPAEDPKFVMVIRINRARSSVYWWETVAATFSKISQYLFNYYKIPPKTVKATN